MKRYSFILGLLFTAAFTKAQDTYTNMTLTNTSDVIGTSRYVGMGGALGALGADISTMSSNPAGIGLYRKNDISLTAGANFPRNKAYGDNYSDNTTRGTFDQFGMVWAVKLGDSGKLKGVNFGVNYQKKANYNSAFIADNDNLGGLSQMDQVAELATDYGTETSLTNQAYQGYLIDSDNVGFYNDHGAQANQYAHLSKGSLMGYDFNISFNVNNRVYLGATLGIDDLRYKRYSTYTELRDGSAQFPVQDYSVYEDQRIDGSGVNLKLGTIIRPIEDDPFRIGLAFETPTWYKLKSSTLVDVASKWSGVKDDNGVETLYYNNNDYNLYQLPETYLEYNVRTPWKLRFSMGSTVDNVLAWGVEYEFANMSKMSQSYDDYDHWFGGKTTDKAMNQLTKDNMRGQHTLKLGFEIKPTTNWAFRMGYNFISSPYKKDAHFDQYSCDSYACDFTTNTSYMNLKNTQILTVGLGYKYKHFYADLAYKYRAQKADFYAFDTSYTKGDQWVADMSANHPELIGASITPVETDLSRHSITATLGFKF